MDYSVYLKNIKKWREQVGDGTDEERELARKKILDYQEIRPWALEYILARVELMLLDGESRESCIAILDEAAQEFYQHPALADLFRLKKRLVGKDSLAYKQMDFSEQVYRDLKIPEKYYMDLIDEECKFLEEDINKGSLRRLAESYYVTRNYLMYFVLHAAWCKYVNHTVGREDFERDFGETPVTGICEKNLGYLLNILLDDSQNTFLLADDCIGSKECLVLKKVFLLLGKDVIHVCASDIRISKTMSIQEAIQYSISRAKANDNCITIAAITFLNVESGEMEQNTADLILFIADNVEQKDALLVFAQDGYMDEILSYRESAKYIQRLSDCQPKHFSYVMSFAWAGDYTKYMSRIYGFSVRDRINRAAECKFSIVIPVHNNARTLRYTLETCLNQKYSGSYEVIVSDNSDLDNHEIHELCASISDEHLRYYRTPQVFNLIKSFEYAFLQARGEFIFSLGADDGLFSWTLQILDAVLEQNKEIDLLKWNRGFYAWPGFNYGQQNQLICQVYNVNEPVNIQNVLQRKLIPDYVADQGGEIYTLALLYINSGFRRSFFQRLLHTTGRLWDGPCQDIYMGVANLAQNEYIVHIDCPLSIAGMSSSSIGGSMSKVDESLSAVGKRLVQQKSILNADWMCGYVLDRQEYLYPCISSTDRIAFFWPLLRLYAQSLFTKEELLSLDWYDMYKKIPMTMNLKDVFFEKKFSWINYSIQLMNGWTNKEVKTLQHDVRDMRKQEWPIPSMDRQYATGFMNDNREFCVDGSLFQIHNVKEAVEFIEHLCGVQ